MIRLKTQFAPVALCLSASALVLPARAQPVLTTFESARLQPINLTAKQVFRKHHSAVVFIQTDHATGTGFVIGGGTAIATCYHVIEKAKWIKVTTHTGEEIPVGKVGVNKGGDAAILLCRKPQTPSLEMVTTNDATPGDEVFVIGNPLGFLTQSLTTGILSSKRQNGDVKFIQITAPISPGSSGSPILDNHGRVLGFVSFTLTQGQSLNMGVSCAELLKVVGHGFVPIQEFCAREQSGSYEYLSVTKTVDPGS